MYKSFIVKFIGRGRFFLMLIVLTDLEQTQDQEDIDNAVFLDGKNRTLEQPEVASAEQDNGVIERFTLEKKEDNEGEDEVWKHFDFSHIRK